MFRFQVFGLAALELVSLDLVVVGQTVEDGEVTVAAVTFHPDVASEAHHHLQLMIRSLEHVIDNLK